jgi:hypothetical protein
MVQPKLMAARASVSYTWEYILPEVEVGLVPKRGCLLHVNILLIPQMI